MISKRIINFLGGLTQEEHNLQMKSLSDNLQMVLSAKLTEIQCLKDQIQDYRNDRTFYQDKLFPTPQPQEEDHNKNLRPVSVARVPWTRRKFELERQDRLKAQEEAKRQADQTEAAIRAKNAKIEEAERSA